MSAISRQFLKTTANFLHTFRLANGCKPESKHKKARPHSEAGRMHQERSRLLDWEVVKLLGVSSLRFFLCLRRNHRVVGLQPNNHCGAVVSDSDVGYNRPCGS